MPALVVFLIGLVGVVVGAELVVRGAASLAGRLGIPPMLIGATIVAIGTSFPELAIGVEAALIGHADLAVANIAGTNTLNLLLILGLVALIRPLQLGVQTIRVDLTMIVVASVLFWLLCLDGLFSPLDAFVLIVLGVAYLFVIIRAARSERAAVVAEATEEYAEPPSRRTNVTRMLIAIVTLAAGLAVILFGADWLVDGATDLALAWGVSPTFIGLTIVAVGTSAPELATAVVSTIRGHRDIAVGNLIGSSVFNIVFILGITGIATPGAFEIPPELIWIDLPVMVAAAVVCVPIFLTGRVVKRWEGALMMALYVAYLTAVLVTRL